MSVRGTSPLPVIARGRYDLMAEEYDRLQGQVFGAWTDTPEALAVDPGAAGLRISAIGGRYLAVVSDTEAETWTITPAPIGRSGGQTWYVPWPLRVRQDDLVIQWGDMRAIIWAQLTATWGGDGYGTRYYQTARLVADHETATPRISIGADYTEEIGDPSAFAWTKLNRLTPLLYVPVGSIEGSADGSYTINYADGFPFGPNPFQAWAAWPALNVNLVHGQGNILKAWFPTTVWGALGYDKVFRPGDDPQIAEGEVGPVTWETTPAAGWQTIYPPGDTGTHIGYRTPVAKLQHDGLGNVLDVLAGPRFYATDGSEP